MGRLFQSIAQSCKNLVSLSILYKDGLDQKLMEVLNNCTELKSLKFSRIIYDIVDLDKVLVVLNQTFPKKLKSISFPHTTTIISYHTANKIMENWKGPRPFKLEHSGLIFNSELFL